jgi:hypothetical protein
MLDRTILQNIDTDTLFWQVVQKFKQLPLALSHLVADLPLSLFIKIEERANVLFWLRLRPFETNPIGRQSAEGESKGAQTTAINGRKTEGAATWKREPPVSTLAFQIDSHGT